MNVYTSAVGVRLLVLRSGDEDTYVFETRVSATLPLLNLMALSNTRYATQKRHRHSALKVGSPPGFPLLDFICPSRVRTLTPGDITFNIEAGAQIPVPRIPRKWKEVIHNKAVPWLRPGLRTSTVTDYGQFARSGGVDMSVQKVTWAQVQRQHPALSLFCFCLI